MELEFRNMLNDLQFEDLADGYHNQTSTCQLENPIMVSRTGLFKGNEKK